jgi:hypothetical protein
MKEKSYFKKIREELILLNEKLRGELKFIFEITKIISLK